MIKNDFVALLIVFLLLISLVVFSASFLVLTISLI